MTNDKTILVTGGAGYIGSNLCVDLIKRGFNIIIADDMKNACDYNINNLQKYTARKIKFYKGDLCDINFAEKIFIENEIQYVAHLASKKYIDESFAFPEIYLTNNNISTQNVLNMCQKYNIKSLSFASSITVYGNPNDDILKENHPYNPLSPYAKSKVDCEVMIKEFARKNPNCVVNIFRFTNPLGANHYALLGDAPKSGKKNVLPYMIDNVFNNKKLMFNGNEHKTHDGTTVRGYIHVMDLTRICAQIIDENHKFGGYICNIANKEGYSVLDILKAVECNLKKKVEYGFNPAREGDPDLIVCDNSRIASDYGYNNDFTLQDMVDSHIEFSENMKSINNEIEK